MNLSNVDPTPCSIMDEYDMALRDLHQEILLSKGKLTASELPRIAKLQEKVLLTRNRIAEKLARVSREV